MKPRRVVLDTNVLVSALMSPSGNPAKIYKMFFTGDFSLVYNESILSEYDDVLHRPYLSIPDEDADKVINAIKLHGEYVESTPSTFPMTDEDDRAFYDTAKSSGAYLVTGNTRHYPNESFIQTPTEFMGL